MSLKWLLQSKFCEESGYSNEAINSKIKAGKWQEGTIWILDPDKRRQINVEEYYKWVEGKALGQAANQASK